MAKLLIWLRVPLVAALIIAVMGDVRPARAQEPKTNLVREAFRDTDGNRIPDRLGETVSLVGVLVSDPVTSFRRGRWATLQDDSGGVMLAARNSSLLPSSLQRGDLVKAAGTVAFRDGTPRLSVTEVRRLGFGAVPEARDVLVSDLLGGYHSGRLVRVVGDLLVPPDFLAKKGSVSLRDRSGTIQVVISDRLFDKPDFLRRFQRGGGVELVGIASQFKEQPPYDSGYQVVPRDPNDFNFAPIPPYRAIALSSMFLGLLAVVGYLWYRRRFSERRLQEVIQYSECLKRSEEALRRAEEKNRSIEDIYRRAITAADTVVYCQDYRTESYSFMGENIATLTGFRPEEMTPQTWEGLIEQCIVGGEAAGLSLDEAVQRTRQGQFSSWRSDYRIRTRDGRTRWIADVAVEIHDDTGRSAGSVGILQDITERKQTETDLAERARLDGLRAEIGSALAQNQDLRTLLKESAEILVRYLDVAFFRIWTLNDSEQMLELQASAGLYTHLDGPHSRVPVGRFKIGLIAQERQPRLTNDVMNDPRVGDREWAKREGIVAFAGYPLMVAEHLVGVMATFAKRPIADSVLKELQSVAGAIGQCIERKRGEEALRQSEEFTRNVVESSLDMIITTDLDRRITGFNKAAETIFGYQRAEVLGQPVQRLYADEAQSERVRQTLRETGQYVGEILNRRRNGDVFPALLSASVLRDKQGRSVGQMGISRDVSEWKRAEARNAAFSVLGQRLSAATDALAAARIIVESADQLFGWDACSVDTYSLQDDAIQALLVMDTLAGKRVDVPAAYSGSRPTGLTRTIIERGGQLILRKPPLAFSPDLAAFGDVTRPSASLMFVPIRQGAKVTGVISFHSYTAEAYQPEDLRTLQALADYCGGALERLEAENILRRSEERFSKVFRTNPAPMSMNTVAEGKLIEVNDHYCEFFGYSRDELIGKTVVGLNLWADPQARVRVVQTLLDKGSMRNVEARYRTRSGEIRDVLVSMELIDFSGQAEPVMIAVFLDITEKKKLEAQFLRAQRLESIGTLASGVAHDLNNILAPILMGAQLLRMKPSAQQFERLVTILDANGQRAAGIIRQLLTFARGAEGERVAIRPKDALKEVVRIARETFPKNITIRYNVGLDVWPVLGDATQLNQVLLNLCVNARDALRDGGTLTLSVENLEIDETFASMTPGAQAGPYVVFQVADTGSGIPREIRDRIFDPFFTTKPTGQGTGLGLSTALGIVKSHRGFIQVESEPGKGAVFKVFLPATAANRVEAEKSTPSDSLRGHGETILVADDEDSIREMTRSLLSNYGYDTLVAKDGAEAITVFAQHGERIKLVLTDLNMPVMDGVALVKGLRWLKPDIKIIASSGLGSSSDPGSRAPELRALGVETFLTKPYRGEKLLTVLRETLREIRPEQRLAKNES